MQGGSWTFLVARSKKKQVHASRRDAEEVSVSDSGTSEQFHSCMRNRFSSHVGIRIKTGTGTGKRRRSSWFSGSGTLKQFQCCMWNVFSLTTCGN